MFSAQKQYINTNSDAPCRAVDMEAAVADTKRSKSMSLFPIFWKMQGSNLNICVFVCITSVLAYAAHDVLSFSKDILRSAS